MPDVREKQREARRKIIRQWAKLPKDSGSPISRRTLCDALFRRAKPFRPVIFLHGVLRAIIPKQAVPKFEVPRHGVLGEGGGSKRQAERESDSRNSKRDTGADGHSSVFPFEATDAPVGETVPRARLLQ